MMLQNMAKFKQIAISFLEHKIMSNISYSYSRAIGALRQQQPSFIQLSGIGYLDQMIQ